MFPVGLRVPPIKPVAIAPVVILPSIISAPRMAIIAHIGTTITAERDILYVDTSDRPSGIQYLDTVCFCKLVHLKLYVEAVIDHIYGLQTLHRRQIFR